MFETQRSFVVGCTLAALLQCAVLATAADEHSTVAVENARKSMAHFHGQVTDSEGEPVRGARIYVVPYDRYLNHAIKNAGPLRAQTHADGRFGFDAADMVYDDVDGLPVRRNGLLVATADGHGPDWLHVKRWRPEVAELVPEDVAKRNEFALRLVADDVPIRGRFLDPNGQPLAGARVRLTQLMIPFKNDLDVHLEREKKRKLEDSGPQYERRLHRPDLIPGLKIETKTDAEGRFTVTGLGRDRLVNLSVSAPSVVNTHLEVMARDAPDVPIVLGGNWRAEEVHPQLIHGAGFSMQLEPGLTVTGLVRDRDTHAPIEGMWVPMYYNPLISAPDYRLSWEPPVTDENGQFTISGLSPEMPTADREFRDLTAIPQPGRQYFMATGNVEPDATVLIECSRGIAYRLKLVDDDGQPVEANVEYWPIRPNRQIAELTSRINSTWQRMNRAARRDDGTYEGFVLPGSGAVVVETPGHTYRSAFVDPKAFFEPGRTDWPPPFEIRHYGTDDTLSVGEGQMSQHGYTAIVLVNPVADSEPLELSATLVRDKPRRVDLIDAEGKPVVGVRTSGRPCDRWEDEPELRSGSFSLIGLNRDRVRPIKFLKEERGLIALLKARGDSDTSYTVHMQPWGAITGRLVSQNGNPRPAGQLVDEEGKLLPMWWPEGEFEAPPNLSMGLAGDTDRVDEHSARVGTDGKFRIDKVIPGEQYAGTLFWGPDRPTTVAFENAKVGPGEVHGLGDIRTSLSFDPQYVQPTEIDRQLTANIPSDAWGKPVSGLRAAIVLRSPPIDEHECLNYDIVAENVSPQDIRFGAWIHKDGFDTPQLVDNDGRLLPRKQGIESRFTQGSSARLKRFWLKSNQRVAISTCTAQLVQLDELGEQIPNPDRRSYKHAFEVQPGRYSLFVDVELGPRIDLSRGLGEPTRISPAEGEWTGKLQTGTVTVPLFGGTND